MTEVKSRRCVACNEYHNGKEMLRVIKKKDGKVIFDKSGKADGRGAYVCKNAECLELAIKSRGFDRSLHAEVPQEVITDLRFALNEEN